MNTEFVVNMSSKTEYFDSDRVLSKWGFTESQCHNCGISNSEINGLLMQCGKCKKAYYCGMKCFNDHLPEHQKYCGTKEMFSQPKGSGIEIKCEKKPVHCDDVPKEAVKAAADVEKAADEDTTPTRKAPKKKKSKTLKRNKSKSKGSEAKKEKTADELPGSWKEKKSNEESQPAQEDEELDLEELADKMSELKNLAPSPSNFDSVSKLNHSFSEFSRTKNCQLPMEEGFTKEEIELRQTELFKREYSWMTPEWMNMQLRKTPKGRKMLENGTLSVREADIRLLLEEGLITWEKPSWTKPQLRQTARGQQIKEEAVELENSFREEFGHSSFTS